MLVEVKVPQLSESVAEATLLSWHKKVGDAVARDENLIDIETDKVVLELPAPAGGVITQIVKADGGTVVSGEVIAMIDTAAHSAAAVAKAAERPAAPVAQAAKQVSDQSNLMPAARKMVEDHKLDPKSIAGSGRDGRVTKADVIAHMEGGAAARPAAAVPASSACRCRACAHAWPSACCSPRPPPRSSPPSTKSTCSR
jgi:2-oxoglutarate dehydrogenase E2 component (dihydrolipoamide succinyltransferase)